jgi:hypothetical protein
MLAIGVSGDLRVVARKRWVRTRWSRLGYRASRVSYRTRGSIKGCGNHTSRVHHIDHGLG